MVRAHGLIAAWIWGSYVTDRRPAVALTTPAGEARPCGSAYLLDRGTVLSLAVVAGAAWYFFAANRPAPVASTAPAPAEAARVSIVVLPFANLSGDPAQDYLADALTDQLTTSLARLRGSFVIARNTAFTFKGKPVDAKAIPQTSLNCVRR